MSKVYHSYNMEYYSVTKRNTLVVYATIWMNLEIIILSGKKANRKEYCIIPFTGSSTTGKIYGGKKNQKNGCLLGVKGQHGIYQKAVLPD